MERKAGDFTVEHGPARSFTSSHSTTTTRRPDRTRRRMFWIHVGWVALALLPLMTFFGTTIMTVAMFENECEIETQAAFIEGGSDSIFSTWKGLWQFDQIFNISLGWGQLEFAQVKVIDIFWDFIIGRCGQAIVSLAAFKILGKALLHSIETDPSSFGRYSAMTFNISSTWAVMEILSDSIRLRQKRSRRSTALLWASVYVCSYAVLFPTILSAITGYQATTQTFLKSPNDNSLIAVDDLQTIAYVIRDGSRIGLWDDYPITIEEGDQGDWDSIESIEDYYKQFPAILATTPSQYCATGVYGYDSTDSRDELVCGPFVGVSKFNASGTPMNLSSPSLTFVFQMWTNSDASYLYDNTTISGEYYETHVTCQPGDRYKWGFSFLGLFLLLLSNTVTIVILYVVWYDTYRHSRADQAGIELGQLMTHLRIAAALRKDLGDDCESLGEKELRKEVRRRNLALGLDSSSLPPSRAERRKLERRATSDDQDVELLRRRDTAESSSSASHSLKSYPSKVGSFRS